MTGSEQPVFWAVGVLNVGRAGYALAAMTAVVWVVPFLAVPMLGCVALPVALPAVFVFAFCPLLALKPDLPWARSLPGAGLLLLGGLANIVLLFVVLNVTHEVLLERDPAATYVDLAALGGMLVVWGLLMAGASLGRSGSVLSSGLFALAFVAVGPLASVVLWLCSSLGLPMGT